MLKSFAPAHWLIAFSLLPLGSLRAQDATNLWIPANPGMATQNPADFWVRPNTFRAFNLDLAAVGKVLGAAPRETYAGPIASGAVVTLPMPDGSLARFRFVDSPVMAPELAAKFPEIKTYLGTGIDDPLASVRFDLTPAGFHAQILSPLGAVYIEPYLRRNPRLHVSFYKHDYQRAAGDFQCLTTGSADAASTGIPFGPLLASSGSLRTYRLACAATGEYTQFQGGTVAAGLAGIVTAINRVDGVYESELAIRLVLVANNDRIVYTNANGDPYNNNSGSTMLGQNQTTLDSVIGSANYDIGHVFSTGGGGIAGLGVVCVAGRKANGVTGSSDPVGDGFYIDYVAHEMGHQFGADHTFNSTSGSCGGGNRVASSAYEPGSGSTIMSYAGICGADDLQPHSDPYFHSASLDQILNYITAGNGSICGIATPAGNTAPAVNAGPNFIIPKGTPFQLTAAGSDAEGDLLTFCWEERDLGSATALSSPDNGASPIFRSFLPSTSPSRIFPQLSDLLNHTTTLGEMLPTTSRLLRFRVVARDNRAGGGGVNSADMQVTVASNAGPFVITSPNSAVTWSGVRTVTWNVAGTTSSPVNATNVSLLLSTNGGISFPFVLATNVPNDGTQAVVLPNLTTSNARIKVQPAGNIFFDISDVDFSIVPATPIPTVVLETALLVQEGCVPGNGAIDPGEAVTVTFSLKNIGTADATNLVVTLLPGNGVVGPGDPQVYGNLIAGGPAVERPFTFTAAGPCGGSLITILHLQDGTDELGWITNGLGLGTFVSSTAAFTNSTRLTTPGSGSKGDASIYPSLIQVSGVTGIVSRVSLTLSGLSHGAVNDLDVLLVGPSGQSVLVMSDVGSGTVSNLTLVFDDAALLNLPPSGSVLSGTYKPTNFDTTSDSFSPSTPSGPFGQTMALFNGLNPNGAWSLYVEDDTAQNVGTLEGWNLSIMTLNPTCCTPATLVNHAPVLTPVPDQIIYEGDTLALTNLANDPDPSQTLVFALNNPPPGAMVVSNTGAFFWTPDESQGPGVYPIAVRVTDNGTPSLSVTQTFNVTVLESNLPPVLAAIPDQALHAGMTLVISNSASDPDLPANGLTFSLLPGAPAGAVIDPVAGVLAWATTEADVDTTNQFTIRVSDDGLPILADEKSFIVTVVPPPVIQSISISNGLATISWSAIVGRGYRLQALSEPEAVWTGWTDVTPDVVAVAPGVEVNQPVGEANRFYRVRCLP